MNTTHLIIGTSAAGITVASKIRALRPTDTILCISEESEFPYNKCLLADHLSGIKAESEVYTRKKDFFELNRITPILGKRVIALDTKNKTVTLHTNELIAYDTLFIGTGSRPYIPAWVPRNIKGIFTFHTLADVQSIHAYCKQHAIQNAVVVGAGLSALESADGLCQQGVRVHLVHRKQEVLNRYIPAAGSDIIHNAMHQHGITFYPQRVIKEICIENNALTGVMLDTNEYIKTSVLVVATGLQPNTELGQLAGLQMHDGYIKVDDSLQTSDPAIWAAGDCVVIKNQLTHDYVPSFTWPDAIAQANIAAQSMCGIKKSYPGMVPWCSSAFFGTQFISAGIAFPTNDHEIIMKQGTDFYHHYVVQNKVLKGFVLVGHTQQAPLLKRMLLTGAEFESL